MYDLNDALFQIAEHLKEIKKIMDTHGAIMVASAWTSETPKISLYGDSGFPFRSYYDVCTSTEHFRVHYEYVNGVVVEHTTTIMEGDNG